MLPEGDLFIDMSDAFDACVSRSGIDGLVSCAFLKGFNVICESDWPSDEPPCINSRLSGSIIWTLSYPNC